MELSPERADLGRAEPWLRAVGLAIWAFTGLSRWPLHEGAPVTAAPPWLGPWLAFGVACVCTGMPRLPPWVRVASLVAQFAAVLALTTRGLRGYEGLLLSVVAAQAPTLLSLRAAVVWAVAQVPFLLGLVWPFKRGAELLEIVGAYSTFTAFALLVYRMHRHEVEARQALAHAHADLLATRALVLDNARQGERLRIARELHDSVGHHLTALSLHLELARQLARGDVVEPVARAQSIAREALGEVRRVVGAMRSPTGVDLLDQLKALAAGIPTPRIHVRGGDDLRLDDPEASHALFRCVQEAITNSLRHAHASHIWVEVERDDGAVAVRVRDDGRGADGRGPGAGLEGMQARVSQLGGTLEFGGAPGGGFRVDLRVPLREVAR